jgi:sulfonate transport system substrate-binding protein
MNAFSRHVRHPRFPLGRSARARVVTATSLALAVLLLMATAPASTLTPAANAQAPLTVRMSYQPVLIAAPLMIAQEKGYFEKANVNVELNVVWQSAELMAAFASGNMDAAAGGIGPAQMNAISRGILTPRLISPLHTERPPVATPLTVRKALWDSGEVRTVADLKGRKVALNKGSNVHYLLVRALEAAGLAYGDIQPVFLAPADARAAFERGAVDAWVIWDPFQAAAEAGTQARTLVNGTGLVANHQFYLADRSFTHANPRVIDAVLAAVGEIDAWAKDNTDAVAAELAPSVGIPAPILSVALKRQTYGVRALDATVIAEQQKIADAFHKLGLLPKPVQVLDAVRRPGT